MLEHGVGLWNSCLWFHGSEYSRIRFDAARRLLWVVYTWPRMDDLTLGRDATYSVNKAHENASFAEPSGRYFLMYELDQSRIAR